MTTPYSASASMLGYLYQCQYALVAATERLRQDGTVTVQLECLDDVDFSATGTPAELLQVKYHGTEANITDSSEELWGTLRVWIDNLNHARIPRDAQFFLATTATAQPGSAAHALRPLSAGRDEHYALTRLEHIATTSTSVANATAYALFTNLRPSQRLDLLTQVQILDGGGGFGELGNALVREIRFARPSRADLVARRLEEWWYGRCIAFLRAPGTPILGEEIASQIEDIADSLRDDTLPIDVMGNPPEPGTYQDSDFIRQLQLVDLAGEAVMQAVKDYFRAFTQRSRWEREDLLTVGELGRYEEQLIEEWSIRFRHMSEDVGEQPSEPAMVQAAKRLYRWVETDARFAIRPRCADPFLTRGSYHMLADQRRVGWHLDFEARLLALLEKQGSA